MLATSSVEVRCLRQTTPTLKATAAHVVFDMLLNLERFRVTQMSFSHFLYAYVSGRVAFAEIVPNPTRCVLRQHLYHSIDERRYHTRCVPPMQTLL